MSPLFNPADDPSLLNLKHIAMKGGERGPLYDQGVLAVIQQIEREGSFTPDPIKGILMFLSVRQQAGQRMLEDGEIARGQQFLAQHGWTLEQGLEFAGGVDCAQGLLAHFEREEGEES